MTPNLYWWTRFLWPWLPCSTL